MIAKVFRDSFAVGAAAVQARSEDINKLNVFPVPDGDTGTNMSLTLNTVVSELSALPADADMKAVCSAITHGSLMGARGNSGVITSQILRGLCEGFAEVGEEITTRQISDAFKRSVRVAFQAVRKPVEGTILTVLRDTSDALAESATREDEVEVALEELVQAAYASVARTPDLLPVLKEHGVHDAGGYGLAIFFEAFVASALGNEVPDVPVVTMPAATPQVRIEQVDDWEGSEFRYCTEFLFHADDLDVEEAADFLTSHGDSELLVGMAPTYKVHVHTDRPDEVLLYMLDRGQISEVHIHNMDIQSQERTSKLAEEETERKPLGFVAVCSGSGNKEILESLGVDKVVSGGQTMNPSTKDILDAMESVNADSVIILPNNKNIILAAQSAASASSRPVAVVPTKSVMQAFSALLAVEPSLDLEDNVAAMTEMLADVHDGEVTYATRESKAENGDPIQEGDVICIVDGRIEVVGSDLADVTVDAIKLVVDRYDGDTLTILAGEQLDDEAFEALTERIEDELPDLEIDEHRGEQPLYPVLFSVE